MSKPKDLATDAKRAAGVAAAELVQDGMLVGLGTGSTAAHFIRALGARHQQGLRLRCVATSTKSWQLGEECGLPMIEMAGITALDIIVDGADEIDQNKDMIKGGGGALLREKILASISQEMVVIVDQHKVVDKLGTHLLPIEVVAFAFDATNEQIRHLGFVPQSRMTPSQELFVTDGGNHIVDIDIRSVPWLPQEIDHKLRLLPGVVETGFFFGMAGRVIIGFDNGTAQMRQHLRDTI